MNFLKKGPELKLPGLKVPDFLSDLYYDLKERHLLPLVAVLAISVVVVPIALSQATGSAPAPEEAPIATPSAAANEASALTVAKSAPGLREYSRRLEGARAIDPFREASEAAASSEASSGAASPAGEAPPVAVTESSGSAVAAPIESSPSVGFPSESEGSGTSTVTKTRYASETVDVRVVTVPKGGEDARVSAKPSTEVRHELPELTMLPSRSTPVAIFMGTSSDGKKALLLVSSDVQSIFGDGQCIVGSQTCQLLALEQGVPETFVYGPQARTFRIEILKLTKTLSSRPRKASLGKSKDEGAHHEAPESAGRISAAQPR
ncbi:MAG TPA: hypothetical protein VGG40_04060 [Solirubrobacterales bacterium]|jgi:hypothetical protein